MDLLELLGWIARGIAILAPLLLWRWILTVTRARRERPGPIVLTVLASVMVGVAAAAAVLADTAPSWDSIVAVGGYWDRPLSEFPLLAIGLIRRAIPKLLAILRLDDARRDYRVWLGMAFAIWGARIFVGMFRQPRQGVFRFLVAEAIAFAAGVVATIYLGPLLLWAVNRLNFWLLLAIVLIIQDCRYGQPPKTYRIAEWLTGRVSWWQARPDHRPM